MPLTQFYHILGTILLVVPLAVTFLAIVATIVRQLRSGIVRSVQPLIWLSLLALVPVLAGMWLLSR